MAADWPGDAATAGPLHGAVAGHGSAAAPALGDGTDGTDGTGAEPSAGTPADWRIWLAPERTALVVVDVQVDFVSPAGAMAAAGIDMSPLEAPLQRIEALVATARAAGVHLVWMRVVTRPETDADVLKALYLRQGLPIESLAICRAGTPGVAYHRLAPKPGEIEIEKPLYSGFHHTALDAQLRAAGVDTLVFTGFTTECCVDTNVREAFHRGHHCVIVADACAAYTLSLHTATLQALGGSCALVVDAGTVGAAWHKGHG